MKSWKKIVLSIKIAILEDYYPETYIETQNLRKELRGLKS